jgi:hypothetical protein
MIRTGEAEKNGKRPFRAVQALYLLELSSSRLQSTNVVDGDRIRTLREVHAVSGRDLRQFEGGRKVSLPFLASIFAATTLRDPRMFNIVP